MHNDNSRSLDRKFKRVGGETTYKTLMMLLSFETTWEYFSNNGMRYDRAGLHNNSLEAVHDDIHMFSGKGHSLNGVFVRAHMTDLAFAGKRFLRQDYDHLLTSAYSFKPLIRSSGCITRTLIVFWLFGKSSIPASGSVMVRLESQL